MAHGKHLTPVQLALAEVWASIDGKLERFLTDSPGSDDGTRDGYMLEAAEAIARLEARGYTVARLSKLQKMQIACPA